MAVALRLLSLVVLFAPVAYTQIDVSALIPESALAHVEIMPGAIKDRGADGKPGGEGAAADVLQR